jgi:hypothetical protein
MILYDELYNTLTRNEKDKLHNILLPTNSNNETKKLLPKPSELYALLGDVIEQTLKHPYLNYQESEEDDDEDDTDL